MCMGGGSPATITQPDYNAYNKQFDLQKAAIEQSMNGQANLMQASLNTAIRNQQAAYEQSAEVKKQLAETTSAQATRMAALIGTPPPEKSAEAPAVGRNRGTVTSKGKGALRIERRTATSAGQGAGLNIT
jgi:hypothetical protein